MKELALKCSNICATRVENIYPQTDLSDAGFVLQNGISVQKSNGLFSVSLSESPYGIRYFNNFYDSEDALLTRVKELYEDIKYGFIADVVDGNHEKEFNVGFKIMLKEHILRSYNYNDDFIDFQDKVVENIYNNMKFPYPKVGDLIKYSTGAASPDRLSEDCVKILDAIEYTDSDSTIDFFVNQKNTETFYMKFKNDGEIKYSFPLSLNRLVDYSLCHGIHLPTIKALINEVLEMKLKNRKYAFISAETPLKEDFEVSKVADIGSKSSLEDIRAVVAGDIFAAKINLFDGSLEQFFESEDFEDFEYGHEYTKASFAYKILELNQMLKERGVPVIDDDKCGNIYIGLNQSSTDILKNAESELEELFAKGCSQKEIIHKYAKTYSTAAEAYSVYTKDLDIFKEKNKETFLFVQGEDIVLKGGAILSGDDKQAIIPQISLQIRENKAEKITYAVNDKDYTFEWDFESSDEYRNIYQKIKREELVSASEYSRIDFESKAFASLDSEMQATITDYINEQSDKIVNAALEEEKQKQEQNADSNLKI